MDNVIKTVNEIIENIKYLDKTYGPEEDDDSYDMMVGKMIVDLSYVRMYLQSLGDNQ